METALFLGLTSGGACLATCGPLAASFLAAEPITWKRSAALLTVFLSGRLVGYVGWAFVSWFLGRAILQYPEGLSVFAVADLVLGGWLIHYGISPPMDRSHVNCPRSILKFLWFRLENHRAFVRGGIWGLLSGWQICPPFLAAITQAAGTGSLGGSLFFFFLFYLGTGIWFIPFPFIGTLGRLGGVAQVARFCALPL